MCTQICMYPGISFLLTCLAVILLTDYITFVFSAGLELNRCEEVVLLLTWSWFIGVCSQTALKNTLVVSGCAAHSASFEHSKPPWEMLPFVVQLSICSSFQSKVQLYPCVSGSPACVSGSWGQVCSWQLSGHSAEQGPPCSHVSHMMWTWSISPIATQHSLCSTS